MTGTHETAPYGSWSSPIGAADVASGGFRGMRERVDAVGADLTVSDRASGPGTTLEVRW